MKNFVAFDFETASGKSPCSLGLVEFKDGLVVNEYYTLINPEIERFNPFAVAVHGIKHDDVKNEKTFDLVWEEVSHFFKDNLLVAHNSSFDISVLLYSLERYNLNKPEMLNCICTLKMSRMILDLDNYKLNSLAEFYSIEQHNYHNSLEDAFVCGELFKKLCSEISDFESFITDKSYNLSKTRFKISKSNFRERKKISIEHNIDLRMLAESKFNIQTDKLKEFRIVVSGVFHSFSRTELKKLIEDNGGKVSSSISSKTSFIVAGDNMGPSKKEKAEKLNIELISEEEFLNKLK